LSSWFTHERALMPEPWIRSAARAPLPSVR